MKAQGPLLTLLASFGLAAASPFLPREDRTGWPARLFDPAVEGKIVAIAESQQDPQAFPQYTTPFEAPEQTYTYFSPTTWTSSFFSTSLYHLYDRAQLCPGSYESPDYYLGLAQRWSRNLWPALSSPDLDHDVGFQSFPFQAELRRWSSASSEARERVLTMARTLSNRFVPTAGVIKSWDRDNLPEEVWVIIDNMINLELLNLATALTGDQSFRDQAISHADKTMQNHIRADGGTFHVVVYDEASGGVKRSITAQGYADWSTWSRGQAWGIWGFASMYHWTGKWEYLQTAGRLADYFLNHLPEFGVPLWDFQAPRPGPLDSSAATIAAAGLLQLAEHDDASAERWRDGAKRLLDGVTQDGLGWTGSSNFETILNRGTVNHNANPPIRETGTVYGDMYFIQAGNYLLRAGLASCPDGSQATGKSWFWEPL